MADVFCRAYLFQMTGVPSNKDIIGYLTSKNVNSGWIDKLKVRYRPLICPFDRLLAYAANAQSVFDIGCGSGQFCSLVAQFTPAMRIHGVEIENRLIENARQITEEFKGRKKIIFERFDGRQLPGVMNEFELVYMIDVLHHIPAAQQETFLHEVAGKMKKGANLVFKDINAAHPFVVFNKLHDVVFSGAPGHELSRKRVRTLLEKTGLRVEEDYTQTVLLYPHFFLIAVK